MKWFFTVYDIHSNGYVHRDLKTDNVLIKIENGEPVCKIADFGFAKGIFENNTSTYLGTPQYMSPEILHTNQ